METEIRKNCRIKAHAKINSFLKVKGKRNDGFHEIETVFHEIDLHDNLNFALTKNCNIRILSNIENLESKDNLVFRVSFFMQKEYRVETGLEIYLEKNIPVAAGLGGGSSDAANTIVALSELWELNLSDKEMNEIAAKFGSDVNFFLKGNTALGTGRGENIEEIPYWKIDNILLINPNFHVSSGDAYRGFSQTCMNYSADKYIREKDLSLSCNDLEPFIVGKFPEIKSIINYCRMNGAYSILSGSGPTVICFCTNADQAELLRDYFKNSGYWTYLTKTIKRK